jgi:hypothetical protein
MKHLLCRFEQRHGEKPVSISVKQTSLEEPHVRKHYCMQARELIGLRVEGVNAAAPVFCPRCGGMVPGVPERHWYRHSWKSPEYDGPICAHGYPDVTCLELARSNEAASLDFRFGASIAEFPAAMLAERFDRAPVLQSWVRPCKQCRRNAVAALAPAIRHEFELLGWRLGEISKRVQRHVERTQTTIRDLHRAREAFENLLADVMTPPVSQRHGFVYLIGHARAVKIGFTEKHPRFGRLGQLQTGSDMELRLLGLVLGTLDDESRLHGMFAKHRLAGEWFTPAGEIFRYFAEHGIQV